MDSATLNLFQWLSIAVFICFAPVSSASYHYQLPRLSHRLETIMRNPAEKPTKCKSTYSQTYFYDQTLDHFNYNPEGYATFRQRYVINSKYWGGAKQRAPIFAYLGAEAPIDDDIESIGILTDNAPRFKALLVYIEHRFYGKSVPFVKFEEALKNKTLRGYFNSAQAIADYAEILLYLKQKFSSPHSPIIVVGGSYGGMLAAWFRLKYPHIAMGALASSAPLLYFDDIVPQKSYYVLATKDYEEVSKSCAETIRQSWSIMDKIASKSNGLSTLTRKFKICGKLNEIQELKDYLELMYTMAAQYNSPPDYPVTKVCKGIDGAPKGTDILGRIYAGIKAYEGNQSCYDMEKYQLPTETNLGYGWQTCSEMVMPIGRAANETMFYPFPFDLNTFNKDCEAQYGVAPRPHWITTNYGGHDIKSVLRNFGSNIIFSNGLRDPYSSAGVLEDISETVVAVTSVNGSHCLDILGATSTDPIWLVNQRKKEVQIMQGWIMKYNSNNLLLSKQ